MRFDAICERRSARFVPRIGASVLLLGLASVLSEPASAHHAAQSVYFTDQTIEVTGEITNLIWRNPHVRFTLAVQQPNGQTETWDVESIPVTRLTRVGLSQDLLGIGESVTVAGYPSRRSSTGIYATNLLLADNREMLLDTPVARWSGETLGTGLDNSPGTPSFDPSLGLFRVWSTDGRSFNDRNPPYPYTQAARAVQQQYDPLSADNPFRGCQPKGMPSIMNQPNPIEFVDRGDRILLRIEEYDTVRTIWMDPALASPEPSILGRSIGRWDDDVLLVHTDRIDYAFFSQQGHRQSTEIELDERFIPSADGGRLDYELTITDPALFDAPVTRVRTWIWVPGAQVLPFECTEN